MPRPTPLSEDGRAAAAAFALGEVIAVNPSPWPARPAATSIGEAPAATVERKRVEIKTRIRPVRTSRRGPKRSERRPANGERKATIVAPGARTRPMPAAERWSTSESMSGARIRLPRLANIKKNPTPELARNARLRNRRGETKGSGTPLMRATKKTTAARANAKLPQGTGE